MENKNSEDRLIDLPIQTENIAFKSEEMIRCAQCERTSPPNRRECFYCGAALEISEEQSQFLKPNLRKLEAWEKGYNLIFLPGAQTSEETKTAEIARLLKIEKENLKKIVEARKPLPLARVESKQEAEIAQKRLSELGAETLILSDEILAVEKPTRRLRGIEFFEGKLILILFNQDEIVEIPNDDLALIVAGATFERRIEATEKYNKKGENKILDATETASDESLIDVYSRSDATGYRILSKGFDFSGLEANKGILATGNMKKLTENLRQFAPNAKLINDYLQVREFLADVWAVEQKNDSQGLKRESFGKFNLGNVTTVSNLLQFTKYSRLQWHLL